MKGSASERNGGLRLKGKLGYRSDKEERINEEGVQERVAERQE